MRDDEFWTRHVIKQLNKPMVRETFLSLNEQAFVLQALREDARLDGRAFDTFRELQLTFNEEYGAANVELGKTRVAVRISAEVTTPYPDRKFEGVFTITTDFSPMTSPAFDVNRTTITESLISRLLEKTVRRSSALDTESLCLIAGSKCFSIRADIHILAHDGNLLDAACIALIAALQHFRRPDVTIEGESVTVWSVDEREPVKLSLMHHPLCITFSYFDSGDIVILDATALEEKFRQGEVVISVNRFGEVCQVAKYGGVAVDPVSLLAWTQVAVDKVKTISAFIQKKLAEDERARNIGDLIAELSAENAR